MPQEDAYSAWLATRPQAIQDLGARFRPWKWYRLHQHRCRVLAFSEDSTMRVAITQAMNPEHPLVMDREVFGVGPDTLKECDAPTGWLEEGKG